MEWEILTITWLRCKSVQVEVAEEEHSRQYKCVLTAWCTSSISQSLHLHPLQTLLPSSRPRLSKNFWGHRIRAMFPFAHYLLSDAKQLLVICVCLRTCQLLFQTHWVKSLDSFKKQKKKYFISIILFQIKLPHLDELFHLLLSTYSSLVYDMSGTFPKHCV